MPIKQYLVCTLSIAAASLFLVDPASAQSAATVLVNNSLQSVQTPTLVPGGGITYSQGANGNLLWISTAGFLFCANPSSPYGNLITLQAGHEDQSFTPAAAAHPWRFAPATDVSRISYVGSQLNVNRNLTSVQWTSLVCNDTDAQGQRSSGLRDGIFDDGWDSATATNYNHLINWIPDPQLEFDWLQPDWTQVPTDPCVSTLAQPALVAEDVACAAVSGVRPVAGTVPGAIRTGTVWTHADATKFIYLFRVDVRVGPQAASPGPQAPHVPDGFDPYAASDALGGMTVTVADAYDASYLKGSGNYCLLTTLPTSLTGSVCANSTTYPLANGPLLMQFGIYPPPLGSGTSWFYVAVLRDLNGMHGNYDTPVVGASVLIDSATVTLGGDKFIGDNIVFGFMAGAAAGGYGFPWMDEP